MYEILIVEDDITLSKGIALALQSGQCNVSQCRTLFTAKKYLAEHPVSLIILDINLPDGSGLELLSEIKDRPDISVIVLTANDTEVDIVAGLEMGANDYITKPFSLAVLRARVNAQLRRFERTPSPAFSQGEFTFDFKKMLFFKNGTPVELSKTEQKLLHLLVENRGLTLTRERILDRVWTGSTEYVDDNALSVTVKRLRNKLEETPAQPRYIKTVYGIGYTWAEKEV